MIWNLWISHSCWHTELGVRSRSVYIFGWDGSVNGDFFPFLKGKYLFHFFARLFAMSRHTGEYYTKVSNVHSNGVSFTHMVSTWKEDEHQTCIPLGSLQLVQGIQSDMWAGPFWVLASQVVLCNRISASLLNDLWIKVFYQERVKIEEFHLIRFFGKSYIRVPATLFLNRTPFHQKDASRAKITEQLIYFITVTNISYQYYCENSVLFMTGCGL